MKLLGGPDHLGNAATWTLVFGACMWLITLTRFGSRSYIGMLVAIALHAVLWRVLPTRSDGRKLPRALSAILLPIGATANLLYVAYVWNQ